MFSKSEPVVWAQPGGDSEQWSDADKYAAALMKEVAQKQGYSAADAQTLAAMAINKRIMNNIQYSDIYERRLAALGFI